MDNVTAIVVFAVLLVACGLALWRVMGAPPSQDAAPTPPPPSPDEDEDDEEPEDEATVLFSREMADAELIAAILDDDSSKDD